MRCPECHGWMRPEREEITTHRGLLVDEWTECEDCGHVGGHWEDVALARELEAERACYDPHGRI